jgi:hypothetical protein
MAINVPPLRTMPIGLNSRGSPIELVVEDAMVFLCGTQLGGVPEKVLIGTPNSEACSIFIGKAYSLHDTIYSGRGLLTEKSDHYPHLYETSYPLLTWHGESVDCPSAHMPLIL